MGKRGLPKSSCDLCRSRKVKCDRETRSDGVCTFCIERKVTCKLSDDSQDDEEQQRRRQRLENQTVAASQTHLFSLDSDGNNSLPNSNTIINSSGSSHRDMQSIFPDAFYSNTFAINSHEESPISWPDDVSYYAHILDSPLPLSNPPHNISHSQTPSSDTGTLSTISPVQSITISKAPKKKGQSLFGVEGLTRMILDQSIVAFFTSVNPYLPLLDSDHFWPRYRAYFSQYSDVGSSRETIEVEPLSILLIIGTAAKGVVQSNVIDKFELQKQLTTRFISLCIDEDHLVEDGLDALEALLLFHNDSTRSPDTTKPLSMHPLEIQVLIKLGNSCKVNEFLPDDSPDTIRRKAIISTLTIVYDAVSNHTGQLYAIKDEDIDADFLPTSHLSDYMTVWLEALRQLALLARHNARRLFSKSVMKRGVLVQDVEMLLQKTQSVYESLPSQFRWAKGSTINLSQGIFSSLFTEQVALIQITVDECGWDTSHALSVDLTRAEQSMHKALEAFYLETVDIAERGGSVGLYNLCVPVLRNAAAGCAEYVMKTSQNRPTAKDPFHRIPRNQRAVQLRKLLDAVKTATNFAGTDDLSSALEAGFAEWQGMG